MAAELAVLIVEALFIFVFVLWAHSLRQHAGLAHFHALLGGLTAVMSWVTDAGVAVEVVGHSFLVGSTVLYTSLLLGVFVIYVFDGPRATRIAISTVAGMSVLTPVIAGVLQLQSRLTHGVALAAVPTPSLRLNTASVVATVADLLFLAIAWEFLGTSRVRAPLWVRTFATLLGVMWLDVLLFSTGAFLGTPAYHGIVTGALASRFVISLLAFPILFLYLRWQRDRDGGTIENRPVLAILREVSEIRAHVNRLEHEIERRRLIQAENERLIEDLQRALAEVKTLRGFLPICAGCKKVRDDAGYWQQIERYVQDHSEAVFSHGLCPDCNDTLFPAPSEPD